MSRFREIYLTNWFVVGYADREAIKPAAQRR
jgi:hypothetical protein